MTLTALINKYGIKHFKEHELVNASSPIPYDLNENVIATLIFADFLRKQIGIRLFIESAYRNKEHNTRVGGSRTSMHLLFNALDLHPVSRKKEDIEKIHKFVKELDSKEFQIVCGDVTINRTDTGIGYYNWGIHIDTRGLLGRYSPTRWDFRT